MFHHRESGTICLLKWRIDLEAVEADGRHQQMVSDLHEAHETEAESLSGRSLRASWIYRKGLMISLSLPIWLMHLSLLFYFQKLEMSMKFVILLNGSFYALEFLIKMNVNSDVGGFMFGWWNFKSVHCRLLVFFNITIYAFNKTSPN